MGTESLSRG